MYVLLILDNLISDITVLPQYSVLNCTKASKILFCKRFRRDQNPKIIIVVESPADFMAPDLVGPNSHVGSVPKEI